MFQCQRKEKKEEIEFVSVESNWLTTGQSQRENKRERETETETQREREKERAGTERDEVRKRERQGERETKIDRDRERERERRKRGKERERPYFYSSMVPYSDLVSLRQDIDLIVSENHSLPFLVLSLPIYRTEQSAERDVLRDIYSF